MSIPTLRKIYQEGRLIPFVGAGVSTSVRWIEDGIERWGPSWKELVDQAADQLGFKLPEMLRVRGTDLQILEYFKLKNAGSISKLSNWLVQHMHPKNDELISSPIHKELASLTRSRIIYTTNYDDFLERALRLHGCAVKTIAVEEHMGSAGDEVEIVKFHGDWDNPSFMVLSESDYEERLKMTTAMDHRFRSDLLGRAALFIGYSFRDPNVSYLFRIFRQQFTKLPTSLGKYRAYIAVPEPSDFELQLFGARDIGVIPIKSSDQTLAVATLLREIGN